MSNVVIVAALVPAVLGFRYPMPLPYVAHKMLHIFGVTMLVGNMTVGPLWLMLAWRANYRALAVVRARAGARGSRFHDSRSTPHALERPRDGLGVWRRSRAGVALSNGVVVARYLRARADSGALLPRENAGKAQQLAPQEEFNGVLFRWSFWGTLVMFPFGVALYTMVSKHGLW